MKNTMKMLLPALMASHAVGAATQAGSTQADMGFKGLTVRLNPGMGATRTGGWYQVYHGFKTKDRTPSRSSRAHKAKNRRNRKRSGG